MTAGPTPPMPAAARSTTRCSGPWAPTTPSRCAGRPGDRGPAARHRGRAGPPGGSFRCCRRRLTWASAWRCTGARRGGALDHRHAGVCGHTDCCSSCERGCTGSTATGPGRTSCRWRRRARCCRRPGVPTAAGSPTPGSAPATGTIVLQRLATGQRDDGAGTGTALNITPAFSPDGRTLASPVERGGDRHLHARTSRRIAVSSA